MAKSKSFCSVCKQKGHWHRDAECPARKGVPAHADSDKPAGKVQTAHAIFETNTHVGESLLAITDCACTKSVMGTSWLQRYVDVLRSMNIEVPSFPEQDNFRFGTSRIFASSYAVVVPFRLGSSWVLLRASVVHGDLPLLVSRSALAALGMVYDLDNHVADFSRSTGFRVPALDYLERSPSFECASWQPGPASTCSSEDVGCQEEHPWRHSDCRAPGGIHGRDCRAWNWG